MPRVASVALALLVAAMPVVSVGAMAQEALPVAPPPAPPPAYEEQILRLSEILGAIHYLRYLCLKKEKETWRNQMTALLDAETPDEARRARMIDRFNRGYEGFRAVYRTCTLAAAESSERYLKEGADITADITVRYGK